MLLSLHIFLHESANISCEIFQFFFNFAIALLTSELQSLTWPFSEACITNTGIVSVPISISKDSMIEGLDSKQISS